MEEKITYTVAALDRKGHVAVFLQPNYTGPALALERLRKARGKLSGDFMVLRISEQFIDEDDLLREIEALDEGSKQM